MTKNQVDWASEHDWYRGYYIADNNGGIAVLVRPDTGETGTLCYFGKPAIVFTDFNELKAWAGY